MRVSTLVVVLLAAAAVGCEDEIVDPGRAAAEGAERARRTDEGPPPLYDAEGALLESDEKVAGLPLPRGLEPFLDQERRHIYRTRVPLRKVQTYFGTRLITGEVDRRGDGATYRAATPRGVRGGVVKLDVSVMPIDRDLVRVEIVELPAPSQLTREQLEAKIQQDAQRWD